MTTFLMIAGAWQGGAAWDAVSERLRAQGHEALTPDLPGLGLDETPLGDVTRRGWAEFLAGELDKAADPLVLVGHSRGAVTVSDAAKLRPDKVVGMIYVAALPPTPDWPLKRLGRLLAERGAGLKPRFTEDRKGVFNLADEVRPIYFNRTPDALADAAIAALRPEPIGAMAPDEEFDTVGIDRPKAYIECLDDRSLNIDLQREMQTLQEYVAVETIDADHSAFASAPDELAAALIRAADSLSR